MVATDFEYNGQLLSDFDMMICQFDSSGGLETVSSGADVTFNQVLPSGSYKQQLVSTKYDTVYTTTFQICKNPCNVKNQDEMILSPELISALQKWLCREKYGVFKIDQENYEDLYWKVVFSAKQIELCGSVFGLELTLTADSNFAYSDNVYEKECNADEQFGLQVVSDLDGYILPNIEITLLDDGDFILKHDEDELLDDSITKINGCENGEVITIDGQNQIITTSSTSHDIVKNFNYLFPRLFYNYGGITNESTENILKPNMNCKIKISYSSIRRVGL